MFCYYTPIVLFEKKSINIHYIIYRNIPKYTLYTNKYDDITVFLIITFKVFNFFNNSHFFNF